MKRYCCDCGLGSIRTETAPKAVIKSYKLFKVDKQGNPYPLFIDASEPLPIGVWLNADSPDFGAMENLASGDYKVTRSNEVFECKKPTKTMLTKQDKAVLRYVNVSRYKDGSVNISNYGINGSGSVEKFALRPGWHSTNAPSARHIGGRSKTDKRPTFRRNNEMWFEIECSAEKDYNAAAQASKSKAKGLLHIPKNGYYEFQTNSNANPLQTWVISGAIRIVKPISANMAAVICKAKGIREDLPYKDQL